MAVDMSAISSLSTSLSQTVGRLSSTASSALSSLPNVSGIIPTPIKQVTTSISNVTTSLAPRVQTAAGQAYNTASAAVSSQVQRGIASQLSNTFGGAASLGSNIGSFASQLGSVTSVISPTLPISLANSVGGDFSRAIQAVNAFNESFMSSLNAVSGRIPNPLRDHNHYNYIITLGILGINEINNPASYRNGGFQKIILRSGGGQYDIRQRVYLEGNEDAEYFIENLNIDALIAPNEKTGIALGTTISFEVVEPYSMGKFIEALIAAAGSAGYNSFNNAPYCLKIEFVGWDEYGNQSATYVAPPYFVPILITKVDFNVKESGSIYQVQAVPYSEISLARHVDVTHTDITTTGRFVHEVLENGEMSVTSVINHNTETIEENTTVTHYDRYMILFPSTTNTIMEAVGSGAISTQGMQSITDQYIARTKGVDSNSFYAQNPELNTFFKNRVSTRVNSEIYEILKSLSVDTSRMNNLGNSEIVIDPMSGATQSPTPPAGMYDDAILRIARRNAPAAQPQQKSRPYTFRQGTRITEIIEQVLLDCAEVRNEASKDLGSNSPKMYRIETYTFVVDDPEVEKILGRPPRVYVYAVHPYVSDQAHYLAPNQKPQTTSQLLMTSAKEYNYFYTGKNEDILNFDITYNYAFLQAAFSDYGQLTATERLGMQRNGIAKDKTLNISPPTSGSSQVKGNPSIERFPYFDRDLSGSQLSDASSQLAVQMHNIFINSNVDLINAEMKIWGDPYYLPTILGNYSPAQQTAMVTSDQSINYLRNDVAIVINFLNPLDYETNGSLMTIDTEINPKFSGIYQVLGVTSQFSKGQFIQDIKMLRQRGQEIQQTTGSERILVTNTGTGLNTQQPSAGTSTSPTRTSATVNTPMQNPAAQLTNVGTIIDTRSGVWANQAITTAASTASSTASVFTSLTNPITALSSVGKALFAAPSTIRSVMSNVRVNTTLSPTTAAPTTTARPASRIPI